MNMRTSLFAAAVIIIVASQKMVGADDPPSAISTHELRLVSDDGQVRGLFRATESGCAVYLGPEESRISIEQTDSGASIRLSRGAAEVLLEVGPGGDGAVLIRSGGIDARLSVDSSESEAGIALGGRNGPELRARAGTQSASMVISSGPENRGVALQAARGGPVVVALHDPDPSSGLDPQRITLSVSSGKGVIELRDGDNHQVAVLSETPEGGAMALRNKSNVLSCSMSSAQEGGRVAVYNSRGRPGAAGVPVADLAVRDGAGALTIGDSDGRPLVRAYGKTGRGQCIVVDRGGGIVAQLGEGERGGVCGVADPGTGASALLHMSGGVGGLVIGGHSGKPLIDLGPTPDERGGRLLLQSDDESGQGLFQVGSSEVFLHLKHGDLHHRVEPR